MTEFPTLLKEVCRYKSDSDRMRHRISRTMRAPNHGFLFSRTHVRATRPCPRRARRRITFYLSTGYFSRSGFLFFPAAAFFFFLQSLLEQLLQLSHGFLFSRTHVRATRPCPRRREGGFLFYLSTGYVSRSGFLFFPRQLSFFPANLCWSSSSNHLTGFFFPAHTSAQRARGRAEREGGFLFYLSTGFFSPAAAFFFFLQSLLEQLLQPSHGLFSRSGFLFFPHNTTATHGAFIFSPMDIAAEGFVSLQPSNDRGRVDSRSISLEGFHSFPYHRGFFFSRPQQQTSMGSGTADERNTPHLESLATGQRPQQDNVHRLPAPAPDSHAQTTLSFGGRHRPTAYRQTTLSFGGWHRPTA